MRDLRDATVHGKPLVEVIRQHKRLALMGRREPIVKANLSDTNLRGADLSDLSFVEANFENSDLSMANLSMSDFTTTNLSGARLEEANLSGAVFQTCDFSHANLRAANLMNVTFDDVDFRGADLGRVKMLATVAEHIVYDDATAWPADMERFGFEPNKMRTWKKVGSR